MASIACARCVILSFSAFANINFFSIRIDSEERQRNREFSATFPTSYTFVSLIHRRTEIDECFANARARSHSFENKKRRRYKIPSNFDDPTIKRLGVPNFRGEERKGSRVLRLRGCVLLIRAQSIMNSGKKKRKWCLQVCRRSSLCIQLCIQCTIAGMRM